VSDGLGVDGLCAAQLTGAMVMIDEHRREGDFDNVAPILTEREATFGLQGLLSTAWAGMELIHGHAAKKAPAQSGLGPDPVVGQKEFDARQAQWVLYLRTDANRRIGCTDGFGRAHESRLESP